jgi:hypothetical protein
MFFQVLMSGLEWYMHAAQSLTREGSGLAPSPVNTRISVLFSVLRSSTTVDCTTAWVYIVVVIPKAEEVENELADGRGVVVGSCGGHSSRLES